MLCCAGVFIQHLIDVGSISSNIKNKMIPLAMLGLASVIAVVGVMRYDEKNPARTSTVCGTVKGTYEVKGRGDGRYLHWSFDMDNQGKRYPIYAPDHIPHVAVGTALCVKISGTGKTGLVNARVEHIMPDEQMN